MKLRSRPTRTPIESAATEKMQVAEEPCIVPAAAATTNLQESNTSSIVSPCKTSPKKSTRNTASLHNRPPSNELAQEGDDSFDILEMMAAPRAAVAPVADALANQGRESAISTSLALQSPGEMMLFPEVSAISSHVPCYILMRINAYI